MWNDSLVYFAGADSIHADGEYVFELFVTDGTAAGTKLISDHFSGCCRIKSGQFL
ncbi:MAG: hypothetical protein R3B47_14800 [Bacteroidia bacterium]